MRAAVTNVTTVPCPVCEKGRVECWRDPGDPDVGIAPGVDDFDADCACYTSGLVDEDAYRERLNEAADWSA